MEYIFVVAISTIISVSCMIFGVFMYRQENTNSLHASCGIFWKIIVPAFYIVLGIGIIVITIITIMI